MSLFAIKSRKYQQKLIEKENFLASKIDKTDYNEFIKKKMK